MERPPQGKTTLQTALFQLVLGGGVTRGWQIHEKNEGLWLGNNIHQMVNLSIAMFDHTGG